jgi:hypothetical protein
MCERNQQLTEKMAKYELSHCWRLLAGLLTLQPTLPDDHFWFQIPIAQGKTKKVQINFYFENSFSFRFN